MSEGVTQPTLVMTGGPLDGTTYPLAMAGQDLVLGSSMDADVQIMLGNVEPHHARVAFGSAGLIIADAGSATGTFVNGEKVEAEQALQEGDRICLGPPGAKGSAKLLVRLPGGTSAGAGPVLGTPAGGEQPLLIDDSDDSPLLLEGDSPAPAPIFGSEPAPSLGAEADLSGEEILAAEEVPFEEGAPLEAEEIPAEEGGVLFDSPLPPPPPLAPPAAEPAAEEPPPAAPEVPLTAPAPPAPAPAQYETDLPSIPFAASEDEGPGVESEPAPLLSSPPPAPAPPRVLAGARGRKTGRRAKRSSVPIVPVAGGLVLLLALGGAGWWFFLRPKPQVATPAPAPIQGSEPGQAAQAAPPPGTPHVSALEPDVALPGETILIRGASLSEPLSVTIGGSPVDAEATADGIRVVMPDLQLPEGQKAELLVQAGGTSLEPLELYVGRSPLVLQLDPSRGPMGETVVIKGRGFAPDPAGNAVTFGGAAGLVLTASSSEISAVAPEIPTSESPEVPVVVTVAGRASSAQVQYFVSRATTSSFTPGFFAAPVARYPGEALAFVSTRIGPVLLLGGPDKSPSTALRAASVSTALNRLVSSAGSTKIEIEYRPGPAPSVAVAGQVDPILVATAEDAAAYSRAWQTGSRSGRRVGARALAQHWAALLQDYFGLFLYKERPLQMVARSRQARVFKDIYSAAQRRSGGRGIPTNIVYPTTEGMAEALRNAALVVSNQTPRPEVAVDGRWQGNINDPDMGTRRFEVIIEVGDKGVTGSMKTWRGSIELSAPLRDITFSRGTVRFIADLRGTAHKFEGPLEENSITGTATREGRSPASFTLEYTE